MTHPTTRRPTRPPRPDLIRTHPADAPQAPRRRIRATRSDEPDSLIAARAAALRPFLGANPQTRLVTIRRLLRAERRAALSGIGYDATRHAALRRLASEQAPAPDT